MRDPLKNSRIIVLVLVFSFPVFPQASSQKLRYMDPVFTSVKVTKNIQYGRAKNRYTQRMENLLLDLYEPLGDTNTARPAVVMVHGGAFVFGDKKHAKLVQMGKDLAKRGYVAVSINYRLAPSLRVRKLPESAEDAQEDTKAAVRFLRRYASKYRIDRKMIAAVGSSAGGFAVVMASYYAEEGNSGNPGYSSRIQAVTDLWGGTFDLNEINPGETPIVIVHGTNDNIVSYKRFAIPLRDKCLSVGIPVDFHPIQGAGHGPWFKYPDILKWSLDWYYKYLKLTQKSGLTPRPGYPSPGTLTLDMAGPKGYSGMLFVSTRKTRVDFGDLGVLGIDPRYAQLVFTFNLSGQAAIPRKVFIARVPAGLKGYTFYWQAILYNAKGIYSFTNTVTTRF